MSLASDIKYSFFFDFHTPAAVPAVGDKFDAEKFTEILKDTTYYQAGKTHLKGQGDTNWHYILIKSLPGLSYLEYWDYNKEW